MRGAAFATLAFAFVLALVSGCASSRGTSTSAVASTTSAIPSSDAATEAAILGASDPSDPLRRPGERNLRNIRQLTFGGENAEAYFAWSGERLVFQSTRDDHPCDRIFSMSLDGSDVRLLSTGTGRTTCSYFLPGDREILYASTHALSADCPPRPDYSRGYVWALYDYDLFATRADDPGRAIVRRLTDNPGYDAEATVSPAGDRIIWTSHRDGDIDLYSMRLDGGDVRRLTTEVGYDGGAFYSPDGKRIVYRSSRPKTADDLAHYRALLAENLVEPKTLEIMIADANGANAHAITSNGAANFAPYWFPDGRRILFASNVGDPKGRNFDVYMINDDGTGMETVIADSTFDGFPVLSPDGSRLVFASNRASKTRGETNLFIADWVE